jgi:hypothetical protein
MSVTTFTSLNTIYTEDVYKFNVKIELSVPNTIIVIVRAQGLWRFPNVVPIIVHGQAFRIVSRKSYSILSVL